MAKRSPFTAIRSAIEPVVVRLSDDEQRAWRAAISARLDAVRHAERETLRLKLAIAEAVDLEIAMVRKVAAVHGFDPEKRWTLTDDGRVVTADPGSS